jgi:hypothetical protein
MILGLAHAAFAGPHGQERPALEKKLLGRWYGQGGCDGNLLLRNDGTFELKEYGPAPINCAGAWKVRGHTLPAALELAFKSSDDPDIIGTALRVKIVKLDAQNLTVEYAHPNGSPSGRYGRAKK